jgi:hypothetical protein
MDSIQHKKTAPTGQDGARTQLKRRLIASWDEIGL